MPFFDDQTRQELAFDEIWSRISPVSPLGKIRQKKVQAFLETDSAGLERELLRLERLSQSLETNHNQAGELTYLLSTLSDISGTLGRSQRGYVLDDTEFYEIKKLSFITEKIAAELKVLGWADLLPAPLDHCPPCQQALSMGQEGEQSFYLADAYDEGLAQAREKRRHLESRLTKKRAAITRKIGAVVQRELSPDGELTVSRQEKQVLAQLAAIAELKKIEETPYFLRFRLEAGGQLQQELAKARQEEENEKQRQRVKLSSIVAKHAEPLLRTQQLLGFLDFLLAKAKFCVQIAGVRPNLSRKPILHLKKARHILLEEELRLAGHAYTPLDIELGPGVAVVTGPNMGGKTAGLQTIGLLTAMAQHGLLVPAALMEFQPRRFIAARLAMSQTARGLSAFAGEIAFLKAAIAASWQAGLILIDEIAHGTNPQEGAVLSEAIIEALHKQPAFTVITTHFPSLAALKGPRHLRVKGLDRKQLAALPGGLLAGQMDAFRRIMDYRWEKASPGRPVESDALGVAEAMGLPQEIIARARALQNKGGPKSDQ